MLSYYSFERKTIKWWKNLFFRLFDLAVVNAHILHRKTSNKKSRGKFSMKKSPKDCSLVPVRKFKCKVSLAVQLAGRDHFLYRIPATHTRLEGKSQRSCRVCAERSKRQTGKSVKKCTTMYCRKCDVGLCIGQCFEVFHTKLNYWE